MPTDGVHLWAVRSHSWEDDPRDLHALLSPEEQKKADGFVFARHRRQYLISHAFLRRVLSWYVPVSPRDLVFGAGPQGKPLLLGPVAPAGLEFNLSHCADLTLVGVATRPIGVDVEAVRDDLGSTGVADYFHPAERQAIAALPADRRSAALYRGWTRKEAVVKAIGVGLSVGLDSFRVPLDTDAPTVVEGPAAPFSPPGPWHLTHVEPLPGVVGAVAVPFRPATVRATLVVGPLTPLPSARRQEVRAGQGW